MEAFKERLTPETAANVFFSRILPEVMVPYLAKSVCFTCLLYMYIRCQF